MHLIASNRRLSLNAPLRLLLAAACLLLGGCSTFDGMFDSWSFFGSGSKEEFEPPETLVAKGMNDYKVGNYSDALKSFQEVLDRHPFSSQAMLAELKTADCQYYSQKYEEAKELYKAFEERHPTNEAVPYVMFQIGMCNLSRSERIDRDPSGARDAVQSFSRLLRTCPQSPYAREAEERLKAAKDFIASHEYFVAVFYVRTKKYDQAKHRLKSLVAAYPETSITPKAQSLLASLESGSPPRWGLSRWLPGLPGWISGEAETGKEAEDNSEPSGP
jgi:outer membrane protein assembly factor BamD